MPKGNPSKQTIASAKYQAKAGYKAKTYKLREDIVVRFEQSCKAKGRSQAAVLMELMQQYIDE